jgi:hypothetical protein
LVSPAEKNFSPHYVRSKLDSDKSYLFETGVSTGKEQSKEGNNKAIRSSVASFLP